MYKCSIDNYGQALKQSLFNFDKYIINIFLNRSDPLCCKSLNLSPQVQRHVKAGSLDATNIDP